MTLQQVDTWRLWLQRNISVVSLGQFFYFFDGGGGLNWQLRRDTVAAASVCFDWQAPLIGIDTATRCVSVLRLLISSGIQRRPQPPPCCHHCSETGVTMIKSALKRTQCAGDVHATAICCVYLHASNFKCVHVSGCGCTQVSHHPDCIAIVFTSAPLLHLLISHSSPTHLSAPTSSMNLHSKQEQNKGLLAALTAAEVLVGRTNIRSLPFFWIENYCCAFFTNRSFFFMWQNCGRLSIFRLVFWASLPLDSSRRTDYKRYGGRLSRGFVLISMELRQGCCDILSARGPVCGSVSSSVGWAPYDCSLTFASRGRWQVI